MAAIHFWDPNVRDMFKFSANRHPFQGAVSGPSRCLCYCFPNQRKFTTFTTDFGSENECLQFNLRISICSVGLHTQVIMQVFTDMILYITEARIRSIAHTRATKASFLQLFSAR